MERINKINVSGTDYAVGGNEFIFFGMVAVIDEGAVCEPDCVYLKPVIKQMFQQVDRQYLYQMIGMLEANDSLDYFEQFLVAIPAEITMISSLYGGYKYGLTFSYDETNDSATIMLQVGPVYDSKICTINVSANDTVTFGYTNGMGDTITKEDFDAEYSINSLAIAMIITV